MPLKPITNLKDEIVAKRNQILSLELPMQSLRIAERKAWAKFRASKTNENRVTFYGIRAAISIYENGGAA